MTSLPGCWHAAASLSGHIDLSDAVRLHPGRIGTLSATSLRALGVSEAHARRWARSGALETSHPFLTLDDPGYPDKMRPLPSAPPVLFHQGDLALLESPGTVAIVGARRCTEDGRRMARDLAQAVARMGGVVVSGMAHGIDTAAHLAAPGRTVAVLGQGLGAPLASSARRTADEILRAGGLLLSEFLPTCPPARHTFPQRNRVIAGLADVTVVVEASRRSGASITARQALEAGREVGAVPGSPYARASAGCLSLLFQGAALIRGPEDLLSLLSWDTSSPTPDTTTDPLLAALDQEGTPFDTLMDRLGICAAELGAGLGALELQGRIRRLPGDRFIRIR